MRGRRRDAGVELRKSRREEQLLKKRNVETVEEVASPLGEHRPQAAASNSLAELVTMIKCDDAAAQLYGTTKCRCVFALDDSLHYLHIRVSTHT